MYVILAFDTEDTYYPPEYHIDDIPGWLAEIMSEVGVRGTFFVMGEKAQHLKERGRTDVLEKMARHDIASHQQGNRYPLIPQVVEGKGWSDGVEAVRQYEDWVKERINEAFGPEPLAFSRHNNYFAPQHVAVAGERGIPYIYMIAQAPGHHQPQWYAGTLTFSEAGENFFGGFDDIYSCNDIFEARLSELDAFIQESLAKNHEWVTVFGCHPVMVMGRSWMERHTLVSGMPRTIGELGWHYGVKPREEEETAKANFRRLCLYLKRHRDLEVVGIEEAARLFSAQPTHITRDVLVGYSATMAGDRSIELHSTFSPAELLCAMADSITHYDQVGDLPEKVERRNVLGPTVRSVLAQEKYSITHEEIVSVCRQLLEKVESSGHLPANVTAGNGRVGLSQIASLAAKSYHAFAQYDKYEKLTVHRIPRYPAIAMEMDAWIRDGIGEHWAMPLDFSCDALAEHARLQTWTMKPAWLRPPQGGSMSAPYAARCSLT